MINTKGLPARHTEALHDGKSVAFCRCWQSGKHPYCDGTHRAINAETGDALGPVVVSAAVTEGPAEPAPSGKPPVAA